MDPQKFERIVQRGKITAPEAMVKDLAYIQAVTNGVRHEIALKLEQDPEYPMPQLEDRLFAEVIPSFFYTGPQERCSVWAISKRTLSRSEVTAVNDDLNRLLGWLIPLGYRLDIFRRAAPRQNMASLYPISEDDDPPKYDFRDHVIGAKAIRQLWLVARYFFEITEEELQADAK